MSVNGLHQRALGSGRHIPVTDWDQGLFDADCVAMRIFYLFLCIAWASMATGCAFSDGEMLKIHAREVTGMQYMPDELTSMFQEMGYRWVPIVNPDTGHKVKTVQEHGEYRMRFEYIETGQVLVDAWIRDRDGSTRLHFYEPGSKALSPASKALLQELQKRLDLEFGQANVSY